MLWKQIKYPWRFVSYVVISLLAMESGGPCGLFRQIRPLSQWLVLFLQYLA